MSEKVYVVNMEEKPESLEKWLNEQHSEGYELVSVAGVAVGRVTRVIGATASRRSCGALRRCLQGPSA